MRSRKASAERHPVEADAAEVLVRAVAALALQDFLARVRQALRAHPSLTAAAEPFDLQLAGAMNGWWADAVDQHLIPTLAGIWKHGYFEQNTLSTGLDAVPSYLAQVRDRLVPGIGPNLSPSIPGDAFNMVRGELVRGLATGSSTEQIAQNLAATFGWDQDATFWRAMKQDIDAKMTPLLDAYGKPGDPARELAKRSDPMLAGFVQQRNLAQANIDKVQSTWQARADRIARTESTGALGAGALAALGKEGAECKEWLATSDHRTRHAHREADGQKRAHGMPFDIGGFPAMFPGDPNLPAHQSVNCRCTVVGCEDDTLPADQQTPEAEMPQEDNGQPLPWADDTAATEAATHAALDAGEMPDWAQQLMAHVTEAAQVPEALSAEQQAYDAAWIQWKAASDKLGLGEYAPGTKGNKEAIKAEIQGYLNLKKVKGTADLKPSEAIKAMYESGVTPPAAEKALTEVAKVITPKAAPAAMTKAAIKTEHDAMATTKFGNGPKLDKHFQKWGQELPAGQQEALTDYQVNSWMTNAKLRSGELESVPAIDAAMASAPGLASQVDVYRVVEQSVLDGLKAGDVFTDKAYLSTTIDKGFAEIFAEDSGMEKPVIMKIRVQSGQQGVWVDAASTTGQETQGELLLPRNMKLTYVGKGKDGEMLFVSEKQTVKLAEKAVETPVAEVAAPALNTAQEAYDQAWLNWHAANQKMESLKTGNKVKQENLEAYKVAKKAETEAYTNLLHAGHGALHPSEGLEAKADAGLLEPAAAAVDMLQAKYDEAWLQWKVAAKKYEDLSYSAGADAIATQYAAKAEEQTYAKLIDLTQQPAGSKQIKPSKEIEEKFKALQKPVPTELPVVGAQPLTGEELLAGVDWGTTLETAIPKPTGAAADKLVANLVGEAPAAPTAEAHQAFVSASDHLANLKAEQVKLDLAEKKNWMEITDVKQQLDVAIANGDSEVALDAKLKALKLKNHELNEQLGAIEDSIYQLQAETEDAAQAVLPAPIAPVAAPLTAPAASVVEVVPGAVKAVPEHLQHLVGAPAPEAPLAPVATDFGGDGRTVAQAKWDAVIKPIAKAWDPSKTVNGTTTWEQSELRKTLEGWRNGGQIDFKALTKYQGGALSETNVKAILKLNGFNGTPAANMPYLSPAKAKAFREQLDAYAQQVEAHKAAMADWRLANGKASALQGMQGGGVTGYQWSPSEGINWAAGHVYTPSASSAEGNVVVRYTGQLHAPLNQHLYSQVGTGPTTPGQFAKEIEQLDAAMRPAPSDFVVHRGTDKSELMLEGRSAEGLHAADMLKLRGTVQRQKGFMSTRIGGSESAFGYKPVKIVFRIPQGHPILNAQPISKFENEREILVGRDTEYFIHDIYYDGTSWRVEAEILPPGVRPEDVLNAVPEPLEQAIGHRKPAFGQIISDVILGAGPPTEETAVTEPTSALNTPLRNTFVGAVPQYVQPNWDGGGWVTAVGVPDNPEQTLGWLITASQDNVLAWLPAMPSPSDPWRRAMNDLVDMAAAQAIAAPTFVAGLHVLGLNPYPVSPASYVAKLRGLLAMAAPGA